MGVRELVGDANGVPASEKVKKHCSRGSGGMLSRKKFEILLGVMAFQTFYPSFGDFTKYDAFCLHIFDL